MRTSVELWKAKKASSASGSAIRQKHREDSGVTAVEYALIIGLVAVVLIGAITILGGNVRDAFGTVACKIQGKSWSATANSNEGGCI